MPSRPGSDQILSRAIDRLNELLPTGDAVSAAPDVVLLGPGAVLDSMAFVNLLVAAEEEMEREWNVRVVLADRVPADPDQLFRVSDLQALIAQAGAS